MLVLLLLLLLRAIPHVLMHRTAVFTSPTPSHIDLVELAIDPADFGKFYALIVSLRGGEPPVPASSTPTAAHHPTSGGGGASVAGASARSGHASGDDALTQMLTRNGLGEYAAVMAAEAVDLDTIALLQSDVDLQDMGIDPSHFMALKAMVATIRAQRRGCSLPPDAGSLTPKPDPDRDPDPDPDPDNDRDSDPEPVASVAE